jgi:hypothetical protein
MLLSTERCVPTREMAITIWQHTLSFLLSSEFSMKQKTDIHITHYTVWNNNIIKIRID